MTSVHDVAGFSSLVESDNIIQINFCLRLGGDAAVSESVLCVSPNYIIPLESLYT